MATSEQKTFDSHFHIIDPNYPIVPNNGYKPPTFAAAHYKEFAQKLGNEGFPVVGGTIVSGSFQAFDQEYLINALAELGPGFAGVTNLPPNASDKDIENLHQAGVRAVRFNLYRGGSAGIEELTTQAHRVFDLVGWHTELYVDARELDELAPQLKALPKVTIDHLGMHADGTKALLELVEHGIIVKATGFGRVELEPEHVIKEIIAINPHALVVGTDAPSTRARRPFEVHDFQRIQEVVGEHADDVFYKNAQALYLA